MHGQVRPQSSVAVWNSKRLPGLSVPNSPYGLCGRKATLNLNLSFTAQELCERRGGRPWLPVPNSPYGLCGRRTTFEEAGQTWGSSAGCGGLVSLGRRV